MSDAPQTTKSRELLEKVRKQILEEGPAEDDNDQPEAVAGHHPADGALVDPRIEQLVDDLLAKEEDLNAEVRARVLSAVDDKMKERAVLHGFVEPILRAARSQQGRTLHELADAIGVGDREAGPTAQQLEAIENGGDGFEELGPEATGRWLNELDIDPVVAARALSKTLTAAAGRGEVVAAGNRKRSAEVESFVNTAIAQIEKDAPKE